MSPDIGHAPSQHPGRSHKKYPGHNLGMTTIDLSLVIPFLSFQNKVLVPINLKFCFGRAN